MLVSGKNGTLYIGVTNNLLARTIEHKWKEKGGFTKKYSVDKLVWFDECENIRIVIQREKQLKKWNRKWKIREIEKSNPEWRDLFYEISGCNYMLERNFS